MNSANTNTINQLSTEANSNNFYGNENELLQNNNKHSEKTSTSSINGATSMLLLQSESGNSQEEINPKSKLANKTIFKTDNPNLNIIEINDNLYTEDTTNAQKSVLLIGDNSIEDDQNHNYTKNDDDNKNIANKRINKAECLAHCGKQKLNLDIAEASAADYQQKKNPNAPLAAIKTQLDFPDTKREITIYKTLEEFEQNLPPTVTILNTPFGSKVYLVGTAHFSEESQDDVSFVIRNVRPDVVMVELCPSRIHILKLDEKTLLEEAKNFNITKIRDIINTHGCVNGIFFILLLQISAQIAKDLGMAPGGEFRRAFEEVHRLPGCMLQLGDRPVRITLHRALRALSMWQTMKLVWRLTFTDTISIEEVEECKQRDLLEKLMQEMAGEFPAFSDVFVTERDMFLCHSLQVACRPQPLPHSTGVRPVRVVGVVGIGHAKGIAEMWGKVDPAKLPEIVQIPPASRSTRICKFTLKYGFIGLTLFGVFKVLRPRVIRFF